MAGLDGSLLDSILGAGAQAMYYCDTCQKETEKHPTHGCGSPTRHIRGNAWMNNDWVNTFCTFGGSLLAAVLAVFLLSAPLPDLSYGGVNMLKLTVSSPAFANGQPIPVEYTCSGENRSPALNWSEVPSTARSLALIIDDPDAPMGTFTHWVVYNLPPTLAGLPAGVPAGAISTGGTQGINSSRTNGYTGPCPPPGKPHRYYFKLFALDLEPSLPTGLTVEKLTSSITGHILAQGEWMGTFQR
jgi:Raf kinase inhibitor-like YbhB/YbcL family protein